MWQSGATIAEVCFAYQISRFWIAIVEAQGICV
jgi:hypothetical protein